MPATSGEIEPRLAIREAERADHRAALAAINALGEIQCHPGDGVGAVEGRLGAVENRLSAIEQLVDDTSVVSRSAPAERA